MCGEHVQVCWRLSPALCFSVYPGLPFISVFLVASPVEAMYRGGSDEVYALHEDVIRVACSLALFVARKPVSLSALRFILGLKLEISKLPFHLSCKNPDNYAEVASEHLFVSLSFSSTSESLKPSGFVKEEKKGWWEVELHREEVQQQLLACVGGSRAAAQVEEEPLVVQQDPCFSSTRMTHLVSRSPLMSSLS
ncbi:hypothetical protein Bca101_018151 [Brassica carinata]